MTCKRHELLKVLRNSETLRQKTINLSDVIDMQNELIVKYQKALELAVFDAVIMLGNLNTCPFEHDCDKEHMTASECKEKFMHRWKSKAGLI